MKEQDAQVACDSQQVLLYVEKDDGSYGPCQTGAWMTAHHLDDFLAKQEYFRRKARRELLGAQTSPVGYYLQLRSMTPADLGARVGLSTRRVRRDCTIEGFSRLTIAQALRYADVFAVTLAELFEVAADDCAPQTLRTGTANPFVTLLTTTQELT